MRIPVVINNEGLHILKEHKVSKFTMEIFLQRVETIIRSVLEAILPTFLVDLHGRSQVLLHTSETLRTSSSEVGNITLLPGIPSSRHLHGKVLFDPNGAGAGQTKSAVESMYGYFFLSNLLTLNAILFLAYHNQHGPHRPPPTPVYPPSVFPPGSSILFDSIVSSL